jgi:hypothetical protein
MARRCNIPDAMSLTICKIDMRMKVCIPQYNYFRKHNKAYRRKHLFQHLDAAKEKEDNKAAKKIIAIIQREKDRSFLALTQLCSGEAKRRGLFQGPG